MATSDALGAVVDLAATHHGAFTRRRAAELGINAAALRWMITRQLVSEPAPGLLLVRGSAPGFERTARAAALLLRDRGAIGRQSAAWIHRFDGMVTPARVQIVVDRNVTIRVGSLPIDLTISRAGLGTRTWSRSGGCR